MDSFRFTIKKDSRSSTWRNIQQSHVKRSIPHDRIEIVMTADYSVESAYFQVRKRERNIVMRLGSLIYRWNLHRRKAERCNVPIKIYLIRIWLRLGKMHAWLQWQLTTLPVNYKILILRRIDICPENNFAILH